MKFEPPAPLADAQLLDRFSCGEPSLDAWLVHTARHAESQRTARTFVVTESGQPAVLGYYALAAGSVSRLDAKGWLARNAPDPVPVIVLARLGVDHSVQGRGVGALLVADALDRCVRASTALGARAVIASPISDSAAAFWAGCGFDPLPGLPNTMYLPIKSLR